MPTTKVPEWIPDVATPQGLPSGRWWDAVQVPTYYAWLTWGSLRVRVRSGSVIESLVAGHCWWLVLPDAADSWDLPVQILGAGHTLLVPPGNAVGGPYDEGPDPRWLVPAAGDCLTDPEQLHATLMAVYRRARGGASHGA